MFAQNFSKNLNKQNNLKNKNIINNHMDFKKLFDEAQSKSTIKFKGNPIKTDGTLKKTYLKLVKKTKGLFPLLSDKIYNIETNRIVNKRRYFTKKNNLRASFKKKGFETNDNNNLINPKEYYKKIRNFLTTDKKDFKVDSRRIGDNKKFFNRLGGELTQSLYASFGNKDITLTPNNYKALIGQADGQVNETYIDSANAINEVVQGAKEFTLKKIIDKPNYTNSNVAFFPFLLKEDLPKVFDTLNRYGIYRTINKDDYHHHCFYYALMMAGVEQDKLRGVLRYVKNSHIPTKYFETICKEVGIHITIKKKKSDTNTYHYPKDKNHPLRKLKPIKLGILENHIFLLENTQFTESSIRDFDKLFGFWGKNFNMYHLDNTRPKGKKRKNYTDSFTIINLILLYREKFLTNIPLDSGIMETPYYNEIEIDECKEPLESETKRFVKRDNDEGKQYNYWGDFEALTKGTHKPYLAAWVDEFSDEGNILYGYKCGKALLKSIIKNAINKGYNDPETETINIYFHNASYDYRVGLLKYLHQPETIEKGGKSLLSANTKFIFENKLYKIVIKDTYSVIPEPLKKFKSMFKLIGVQKEIMPFGSYNEENIKKVWLDINEFVKPLIWEKDKKECIQNILGLGENIYDKESNKVNILKYSGWYCFRDCITLKSGHLKFREMIETICNDANIKVVDIFDKISISGIAEDILYNAGVYKGVCKLGGLVRRFIQKTVVGGRTMLSENKKQRNKKGKKILHSLINSLDANSLYPSAQVRLVDDGLGLPIGKPKALKPENLNKTFLKSVDMYYIKIRVKKVGIYKKFPLCSFINKKTGVRCFSNDVRELQGIYVDKIALEDLVKYQKIEYDIISGYYFNEGFNTKIKDIINHLYDERKKYKKEGNPIEQVLKLILNSSYGRCVMKEIDTDIVYKDCINKDNKGHTEYDRFLYSNYNLVKDAELTPNLKQMRIKIIKPIDTHFNLAHCGVAILSMSKRIMNEVFYCCEENKIDVLYQDTDSTFVYDKDCKKIADIYRENFNKELIGKELGQFSDDLEIKHKGEKYPAFATDFIAVGKKCYGCKLRSQEKINGEYIYDYKLRLKGIPNGSIWAKVKSGGYNNPLDIYEEFYRGNTIAFDLLVQLQNDKIVNKVNFNYTNDGAIESREKFIRKIGFDRGNIINENFFNPEWFN